ncbi:MAG TPA: DNA helicase [Chloroflexi bacterium]|nr:DNA helicase [Chloroflexota bacterium]
MPIEQTLDKIQQDMATGDYGKARDRLHGLLSTYPENLALRRQLGEIYWQLHYPTMAGRYWYLEEDKSAKMVTAVKAFEQSCGNQALKILQALKFQGRLESLTEVYAQTKLQTLQAQVKTEYGFVLDFQKQSVKKAYRTQSRNKQSKIWQIGCLAGLIIALVLMVIGLLTTVSWLF